MNKYNNPKNVWFVDYTMCLLENDNILMNSEMTVKQLRAQVGDSFVFELDQDNRIILKKVKNE